MLPTAVKRNGALFVILGLTLAVYLCRTVPAQFRNGALREAEARSIQEIEKLREEADRMQLQIDALESRDPATLSRIVHARLLQGKIGIEEPEGD